MQYKILLIEDSKIDQLIFKRLVKEQKLPYDYSIASSVSEAKQILSQQKFDLILTDHQLGDGTGFDILNLKINTPVIMLSGGSNEEIALQALQLGAYNYLIKNCEQNYLKILPLTVENTVQRWKAEGTSALLLAALTKIKESVYIINSEDDKIIFVNPAFTEIYGYQSEEIIGQPSKQLWPEFTSNDIQKTLRCTTGLLQERGEYNQKRKNQTQFRVYLSCSEVEANGQKFHIFVTSEIRSPKQTESPIEELNKQLQEVNQKLQKEINIRQQTQENLQSTLSLQQAILDNPHYAIISYCPTGKIMTFNKGAENLLGYSADEVISQKYINLFHDPQEIEAYITEMSKKLGTKFNNISELFCYQISINCNIKRQWNYINKNQIKVPVFLSLSPWRDQQANIIGFLTIAISVN